jgi:hypothetical protein
VTYETDPVLAGLRAKAREQLSELDTTIQQLGPGMDLDSRLELGAPVAELRRLLHGDSAPPAATTAAPNVKHLVAVGTSGPAFGVRAGVQMVVGRNGLRSGALDVPPDGPEVA